MKKLTILLALLVALIAVPSAQAQTAITTTTLTNAITNTGMGQFNIVVGSATGMAANGILYIDGSVYQIRAVSGTTITVINTVRPASHNSSVTIYVVPLGAQIGLDPVGSCLRSTAGAFPVYSPYTLMFNTTNGDVAACRLISGKLQWVITNPYCNAGTGCSGNPPQSQ